MRDDRDDSSYAKLAARALGAVQPSAVPPPIGDRTETIAALERALRARTPRRVRPWWVLAPLVAAAAAAVVLVNGIPWREEGRGPGRPELPAAWEGLRAGTELRGPSSVELAIGTRLHLDAHAIATVIESGTTQKFRLETGALRAEVAKLAAGRRFLVETPDAEIEVKGTRFDVGVTPAVSGCGPGTRTHVTVHEGVVAVRFAGNEVRLAAGAEWPDCASRGAVNTPEAPAVAAAVATAQASQAAQPETRATSGAPRRPRRGKSRPDAMALVGAVPRAASSPASGPAPATSRATVAVAGASTLADQNDLLAAALAARQRGDGAEALRWLDRLLSRYPDGQLVQSARAERQRLLDGDAATRGRESE